jgi:hypothetical protein
MSELVSASGNRGVGLLTESANDERYEVPGPLPRQLKDEKSRRDAEKSNEDDRGNLAWVVMVENVLRSWNESINQRHHVELRNSKRLCKASRSRRGRNKIIASGSEMV